MSRDEKDPTDDYPIGKNRPPAGSRWKKGQSGNPRGRPKARKCDQLDVAGILNSPVNAQINGKKAQVSAFEASILLMAKKAIGGEMRSIKQFLNQCDKYELIRISEQEQAGGVVHAPKDVDFQDWLDEVTELVPRDEE